MFVHLIKDEAIIFMNLQLSILFSNFHNFAYWLCSHVATDFTFSDTLLVIAI